MIIKLIISIFCVVILAFFAGFNLENKCDVNVLFHTFSQVPVFLTIIISFVAGVIVTLPFAFINKAARKGKLEKKLAQKLKKAEKNQKINPKKTEQSQNFAYEKKDESKTDLEQNKKESEENLSEDSVQTQVQNGNPV